MGRLSIRCAAATAAFTLAVLSAPLATPLSAQQAAGDSIVVTLPSDLSAEERKALIEALAALQRPVSLDQPAAASTGLPPETQVTVAMARWDAALASWRDLPGLVAAWWRGLSAEPGAGATLLVLAAMLVALVVGAACEWILDRLLGRWRRKCSEATPAGFARRAGYGLGWVGIEVLGIAAFAAGAVALGWLLLPALATPRLTLAVIIAAIAKARLVLTIARFIVAPSRPALRLAPLPDGDAQLVWRWVAISVSIIAAANGFRDVLLSAGPRWESIAFLGLIVATLAAVVRLVAINQVRLIGQGPGIVRKFCAWASDVPPSDHDLRCFTYSDTSSVVAPRKRQT